MLRRVEGKGAEKDRREGERVGSPRLPGGGSHLQRSSVKIGGQDENKFAVRGSKFMYDITIST
jgi:hypothetical protein